MEEFKNHNHPDMIRLKEETIKDENIIIWEGYFRYINPAENLLTTGFKNKYTLLRNKDMLRFDTHTIELMKNRYNQYNTKPVYVCPECGAEYETSEEESLCCDEYR